MLTFVFLFAAQKNKDITHIYHSVSPSQSPFWDMNLPHEEAIMTESVSPAVLPLTPTKGVKKKHFSRQPPDSWTGFNFPHSPQKLLRYCSFTAMVCPYLLWGWRCQETGRQPEAGGAEDRRRGINLAAGLLVVCSYVQERIGGTRTHHSWTKSLLCMFLPKLSKKRL